MNLLWFVPTTILYYILSETIRLSPGSEKFLRIMEVIIGTKFRANKVGLLLECPVAMICDRCSGLKLNFGFAPHPVVLLTWSVKVLSRAGQWHPAGYCMVSLSQLTWHTCRWCVTACGGGRGREADGECHAGARSVTNVPMKLKGCWLFKR